MTHLISCEFNMDTACVELKFTDGSMIAMFWSRNFVTFLAKKIHYVDCFQIA